MPEPELFLLFVRPLNEAGIRYMVAGSIAVIFYGEPRLTHDVDFVAFLNSNDIARLPQLFPNPDFYVPPSDVIALEASRAQRGSFNIIHAPTGFKADFYLTGRDELNAWGFRFKREAQFQSEKMVIAPPEYVIVRKLEFFREGGSEKHIRDIRSMLAVSREQIDQSVLHHWIGRLGLQPEWSKITAV